jgi:putative endonuclease
LAQRLYQHREGRIPGFTRDHSIKLLVVYEMFETMDEAILREMRLKKWRRAWKIELIESQNLYWEDLAIGFGFDRLTD